MILSDKISCIGFSFSILYYNPWDAVSIILTGAHGEEDPPVRVVELHPVVAGRVDELVAGGALQERGVHVQPVARDVNGH